MTRIKRTTRGNKGKTNKTLIKKLKIRQLVVPGKRTNKFTWTMRGIVLTSVTERK